MPAQSFKTCNSLTLVAVFWLHEGVVQRFLKSLSVLDSMLGTVDIRRLLESDSIAAITGMLHRAYAPLGESGLNYTAVDQSEKVTAYRASLGECVVAEVDGNIVGTATLVGTKPDDTCAWYRQPYVASVHQFAVEPNFQRNGIGSEIMCWAEARAMELGFSEIAIDTAEAALNLVSFYSRRGYRFIQFDQGAEKYYRSVILSKPLAAKRLTLRSSGLADASRSTHTR